MFSRVSLESHGGLVPFCEASGTPKESQHECPSLSEGGGKPGQMVTYHRHMHM